MPKLPRVPPVGASKPAPAPEQPKSMADMLAGDPASLHFRRTGTLAPAAPKKRRFWVQLDEDYALRLERLCVERRSETGERVFSYSKACSEGLVLWVNSEEARRERQAGSLPLNRESAGER